MKNLILKEPRNNMIVNINSKWEIPVENEQDLDSLISNIKYLRKIRSEDTYEAILREWVSTYSDKLVDGPVTFATNKTKFMFNSFEITFDTAFKNNLVMYADKRGIELTYKYEEEIPHMITWIMEVKDA